MRLQSPDTVNAGIRVLGMNEDRLTMECLLWSNEWRNTAARITAEVMIYPRDPETRLSIAAHLKDLIEGIEQRSL